jgi:hypothetical protein
VVLETEEEDHGQATVHFGICLHGKDLDGCMEEVRAGMGCILALQVFCLLIHRERASFFRVGKEY